MERVGRVVANAPLTSVLKHAHCVVWFTCPSEKASDLATEAPRSNTDDQYSRHHLPHSEQPRRPAPLHVNHSSNGRQRRLFHSSMLSITILARGTAMPTVRTPRRNSETASPVVRRQVLFLGGSHSPCTRPNSGQAVSNSFDDPSRGAPLALVAGGHFYVWRVERVVRMQGSASPSSIEQCFINSPQRVASIFTAFGLVFQEPSAETIISTCRKRSARQGRIARSRSKTSGSHRNLINFSPRAPCTRNTRHLVN